MNSSVGGVIFWEVFKKRIRTLFLKCKMVGPHGLSEVSADLLLHMAAIPLCVGIGRGLIVDNMCCRRSQLRFCRQGYPRLSLVQNPPHFLNQLPHSKGFLYEGITATRQYLLCLAFYAVAA